MVSPLFYAGKPSADQISYSIFIKPDLVTTPPIKAFDFQTEEDYSDQMEVEMKWINDKHRLEEQNSVHQFINNEKNQDYSIPQSLPIDKTYVYNNYYLTAQNRVPFSLNSIPQNNLHLNSLKINSKFIAQNERVELKSDFNKSNILNDFPKNSSFGSEPKGLPSLPYKTLHITDANTNANIERLGKVGEWQRVIDSRGKSIEQRVISLSPQTYNFPKKLDQISETQNITDSEHVMTVTLQPIIEEKELDLSQTKFL